MLLKKCCSRWLMFEEMDQVVPSGMKSRVKAEGIFEGANCLRLFTEMCERYAVTVVAEMMVKKQTDPVEREVRCFAVTSLPTSTKRKPGECARILFFEREAALEHHFGVGNQPEIHIGRPGLVQCLN